MNACRILLLVLVVLAWAGPAPAAEPLVAFTGLSTKDHVMQAAEEATQKMMAKFRQAGREPEVVLFFERVTYRWHRSDKMGVTYQQLGDRIKKRTGADVFGHGGCGPYGIVLGEVSDKSPSFQVIGLAGADIRARGYALGGRIDYMYTDRKTRQAAEAGDAEALAKVAREKKLRAVCRAKGQSLGRKIPDLDRPGFVLLLGALHNNWHTTFAEGLGTEIPATLPVVGGVGKWDDYVYNNGQAVRDADEKESPTGQLAVLIDGDMQVVAAGICSENTWKKDIIDREAARVATRVKKHLDGAEPEALLVFSCVTRLRNSKRMDPSKELDVVRKLYGQGPAVFGAFCGGEFGWDLEGKFTSGGDHLTLVALAGNSRP
jgi:hypothetical protein